MQFCRLFSLILVSALLVSFCLMVSAHATSTWSIQTIGPSTNGEPISLAIDSNGNPHIAYSNYPNTNEQSGTWNITFSRWKDFELEYWV